MSRRELTERLHDLFPALYLTLASIIQGVAFSYLIGAIHERLDHLTAAIVLESAATLVLITAVWSTYAFSAFALVWYPTVFDGLIPFAFGATEVLLALSVGENTARWLGFTIVAMFFGFVTLMYAYRLAPLHPRNAGVFTRVMQSPKVNFLPLAGSCITFGLWALTERGALPGASPLAPALVLFLFTGYLANTGLHWRRFVTYLREG